MSNVYLTELTNQKKKLATILNNKGVVASESEKFNTLVPKVAQVQNLKGEEKVVDNISTYNDTPESMVQLEYPENVEKNIDLQLSSKNLIPYPYDISGTTKKNGLSITVNNDGTITVNGTATADTYVRLHGENSRITLAPGTYTLSGCAPGGTFSTYKLYTQNGLYLYSQPNAATDTISKTKSIEVCFVVYNGVECNNLVFKPQLELGSTATAYTPYISDFSTVNVTACGKNLFDLNSVELTGAELVAEGIKMTASSSNINIRLPAGRYTLSFKRSTSATIYVRNGKVASGYIALIGAETTSSTFNYTASVDGYLRISVYSLNLELTDIQLERDSTVTSYEPYQGQTYTPTSDGKVTGISSIYPITNIFTDNTGALITVKGGAYKEILPSTGKNGIAKIWQEVVGSDIDENIKPENIKKGITILGVTGTME